MTLETLLLAAFWDTQRKGSISMKWPILIYSHSVQFTSLMAHWTTREWISWNGNFGFQEFTLCQIIHYSEKTSGLTLLFASPLRVTPTPSLYYWGQFWVTNHKTGEQEFYLFNFIFLFFGISKYFITYIHIWGRNVNLRKM